MKKFITVADTKVQLIHYMPFDAKEGLGRTEEELSQMGYLIDEIPDPEIIEGKIAEAHYTPERGFWYEYVDAPEPEEPRYTEQEVIDSIVEEVQNG